MSFIKSLATFAFISLLAQESLALPASSYRHSHHAHADKRSNTCSFPTDKGFVEINNGNNGWAQSSSCKAGSYCQYACPPGQLMGQWNPSVTTYSYPGSQDGGIYCNDNGEIEKPISDNDYCYDGKGTLKVKNSASKNSAFCQTVLPGSESMLIPTNIDSSSTETLAVPGTEYWASTAAHYYINPPGVSTDEGCQWGSTANPYGNWSPYVAGANMDDSENTYVKIAWNPIYFEDSSPFKDEKPSFGIKMYCNDDSKCNGDACEINPSTYGLNKVSSGGQALSDGAAWCVLTATDSSSVTIEVFDV
ncbi:hypothetical protein CANARDRAFT_29393 [[Candida] arabinofermentans NRRL YB-2248]|uniref:Glycoside hydrolase family 132 protein n=1 Tax=[Candida] arabinofermentans NRRL YB-2248 TaxID=983967 RepID=A0A1E4SXK9_9ASCO|nr:hypothetical protein CANARDRAFT_29393 [[Candida] arabinofermentans NRRL YB-2248]